MTFRTGLYSAARAEFEARHFIFNCAEEESGSGFEFSIIDTYMGMCGTGIKVAMESDFVARDIYATAYFWDWLHGNAEGFPEKNDNLFLITVYTPFLFSFYVRVPDRKHVSIPSIIESIDVSVNNTELVKPLAEAIAILINDPHAIEDAAKALYK